MNITPELIDRFFKQKCTPEENLIISEYFDHHPDELEMYLNEDDWQKFADGSVLHPAISQKMLDAIESGIAKNNQTKKVPFKALLIAASVIAFVGIALLIRLNRPGSNQVRSIAIKQAIDPSLQQINDTIRNKTANAITFSLPDNSKVILSATSEIYYNRSFTQKQRNVYLRGEAVFKVAKNKSRPFTVFSGRLSTTALGTCFKVTAFVNSKAIYIKLYEGKIVIKHSGKTNTAADKDVFLTPNHELYCDNTTGITNVSTFKNDAAEANLLSETEVNTITNNGIIKFNNEHLAAVLKKLAQVYNISIKADRVNLSDKYFTGTVNSQSETADGVLNTLALLNKLALKRVIGGGYVFSPKPVASVDTLNIK